MIVFSNPDNAPFSLTSFPGPNNSLTLNWQSIAGRSYDVEGSTNWTQWIKLATNLVATEASSTFSTNVSRSAEFFRVYRVP